ncbi:MAG: proteasome subunit alpha [Nitrospirales bacterium]|nr:proteasome subunit alpha [Nitrospirales bacterium]
MNQQGDFVRLLREEGYQFQPSPMPHVPTETLSPAMTQGTTVLAVKYQDGVLVAGDRRATAGNIVMYDRTEKVLELDRSSVIAIAGAPATAFEMARVLEHSFKYYRRSQLQDLSFEGKLRALTKLLKDNSPAALAGTGAVAPIFAGYDSQQQTSKIFFYDILGAEFEGVDHAISGSGSPTIRGILHYLNRWSEQPLSHYDEEQAIVLILKLLVSAAEFDSATGGINREAHLFPTMKCITEQGIVTVPSDRLRMLFDAQVAHHV